MKHFLIGNFGNESIALLQWCIEQSLPPMIFLYVNTGWAAEGWEQRIKAGKDFASLHGIQCFELKSPETFAELVIDRQAFPNKKFQWCAGFLKGLALNNFLETHDPLCEATLLLAKRKSASRSYFHLSEMSESEYYNQRKLWYPIFNLDEHQRDQLILKAGFEVLTHRSLECQPCIHMSQSELQCLSLSDKNKLYQLEEKVAHKMFPQPQELPSHYTVENFEMGCGSPWGCGE